MLLTGGQISVAISSGIVCIFTTLLFLAGYVLQQQTIRSLQVAIRPKSPSPPVPTLSPILAKHFGRPPGHSFYDKYLASNRPKGGWAKTAYVQLVRSHDHVCTAVMAFAALSGQESMAQRILLYPSEWELQNEMDPVASVSARLLRKAASKYKVMLQPIDPIRPFASNIDDEDNAPTYSEEESYPLTTLLTLSHYSRIIYLQPSGLILSSTPLDLLFSFPLPQKTSILAFDSPLPSSADRPSILLLEPSPQTHDHVRDLLPEGAFTDTEFLSLIRTTPAPPSTPSSEQKPAMLLAETSALENVDAGFNATWFLDSTGYVHIQDDGIKGPQFEQGRNWGKGSGPSRREARRAWEGVYELFREGWMEVCGLDLLVDDIDKDEGARDQEGEKQAEQAESERGLDRQETDEVAAQSRSGEGDESIDNEPNGILPDDNIGSRGFEGDEVLDMSRHTPEAPDKEQPRKEDLR